MGLIQALSSVSGLRQFVNAASFDPRQDLRDYEPRLDLSWDMDTPEAAAPDEPAAPPADLFLVCEQSAVTASGQPVFGPPSTSSDDDLALSEDGYLINGEGQFLLGMTLGEGGKPAARSPEVVRVDMAAIETQGTSRIHCRANLPAYPQTATADFDEPGSELLDKTAFARDPSVHGSGIVLGDERQKFLDRTLAGGAVEIVSPDGRKIQLVLRWAKMTSLRSTGRDSWNLFYRVRRDARSGEVAWRNTGYTFYFGADGRLEEASLVVPVMDMMVDGARIGNMSLIFGAGGVTQFADRSGLVKVLKSEADGCIGGEFTGISMSGAGRLFAHYSNGVMRALADIQFTGEESWLEGAGEDWTRAAEIRTA
jgi:hypothetical protein